MNELGEQGEQPVNRGCDGRRVVKQRLACRVLVVLAAGLAVGGNLQAEPRFQAGGGRLQGSVEVDAVRAGPDGFALSLESGAQLVCRIVPRAESLSGAVSPGGQNVRDERHQQSSRNNSAAHDPPDGFFTHPAVIVMMIIAVLAVALLLNEQIEAALAWVTWPLVKRWDDWTWARETARRRAEP